MASRWNSWIESSSVRSNDMCLTTSRGETSQVGRPGPTVRRRRAGSGAGFLEGAADEHFYEVDAVLGARVEIALRLGLLGGELRRVGHRGTLRQRAGHA